ncbi:MAG: Glucose-1-phosphate adenylyltransferase [Turneriella sp.]|nr:Glucose-1-phosphate adenylyltransferase [Turneriella sp.]MCZ2338452.1 nucleotidyltransferase family protein [Chitinophagales bacterium]
MKNWQSTLLERHATIRDAMRLLDKSSLRIVLVCDENLKLLGTITDGDIRRALLADANMQDIVQKVMNSRPLSVKASASREERLSLMQKEDLTAIPIVDDENRVLGLETLHQAMQPEPRANPVFIMAGGFGTRLAPLTDHCPKPMLRIGDKPMLEHLILQFKKSGFSRFFISTHYMPHVIQEYFGDGHHWGAQISYVHEDTPLGTGGALGLLPKDCGDLPLLMMNGDVLTKLNYTQLLKHHERNKFDATICVREDEHRVPFGVIETEDQLVANMIEKPTYRYKINTGIYVLDSEIVASVAPRQRIDLPTLLEQHRLAGKRVGTYTSYDYWLDIGQMKDYQKAQRDIEVYFKSH